MGLLAGLMVSPLLVGRTTAPSYVDSSHFLEEALFFGHIA